MKKLFYYKIPFGIGLLIIVLSILITSFATYKFAAKKIEQQIAENSNNSCSYDIKRLQGYNYINPLMFVDNSCESENLSGLKQNIVTTIDNYKKNNVITSASVYLKEYKSNDWMCINPDEKFKPGSLLKIPELIAFLRMDEKHPGLLNKEYVFDRPFEVNKTPVFVSNSIKLGQKYTVKQLLTYMIKYSDNNATLMLNNIMDVDVFKKVFTDLGLPAPDWKANDYPVTATDCSLFLRALYNASYLTINNSEYATELLGASDFKDGIEKGIPSSIRIAHKFGEAGDATEKELHETAIIYLENRPYLLTVMTKGNDIKKLPQVISQISGIVYQTIAAN